MDSCEKQYSDAEVICDDGLLLMFWQSLKS
jgi:hypothetical protein